MKKEFFNEKMETMHPEALRPIQGENVSSKKKKLEKL